MRYLVVFLFTISFTSIAGTNHEMPHPKISPNFEKMKALVGNWEGTGTMHGTENPMKVSYELTSGGTALIEKLMPGTPEEMVTVYSTRNNEVQATHYCMLGNQPEMKLKKVNDSTFSFEMEGTKGISDKNEMHMHSVVLALKGDSLKQEWVNYQGNKKGEVTVFNLKRK